MEVVIESDSDESVELLIEPSASNKQAFDNHDLIDMLSESDSYESLDMVIDNVPSSAAPSSTAPSQPPIIGIPRYLDGTQPVDVLEVFGRTVSAIASQKGAQLVPFRPQGWQGPVAVGDALRGLPHHRAAPSQIIGHVAAMHDVLETATALEYKENVHERVLPPQSYR